MKPIIFGKTIDQKTRCVHYHSDLDIVAIKFACCERYYPCYQCHEETAGHQAVPWPRSRFHEKAILCGNCQTELTVHEYLNGEARCPECRHPFNPGCKKHYHFYFE
ncbi:MULTISPECIES: CHY zinc finger protein [Thermoactinomyces]|jgi:uncharacterized CHY-type Zn-finger protein|uniref:CHY-type domain-containing protein n=1 Tax=Thermoactinomyces daqus TaxID=1329516 RepID=A0A7W2AJD6_9BACL|nr:MULTISPECIES: CHY zinc finger protein [Thermoactinomyces]MBA4543808.1 hypothetical protein [Thermoactinomyces daqus]MBH8599175.1 hypothetical protein [Thermoactinomyces sp. CICC 10523]MBH8605404.1 hypothetical protein [Thermoactinomyces sp. CICC 10522]MBH8609480.1 hypothetical protein [Thermoactinomyces sp. CICC 10521]